MLRRRVRDDGRFRRKRRIRKKVAGTTNRPRLTIYRSNKHIYAQIVDDDNGHTVASASTLEEGVDVNDLNKTDAAKAVGSLIAQRAQEKGIEQVVFDRNGYIYHGRVAAVAQGARDGGLQF